VLENSFSVQCVEAGDDGNFSEGDTLSGSVSASSLERVSVFPVRSCCRVLGWEREEGAPEPTLLDGVDSSALIGIRSLLRDGADVGVLGYTVPTHYSHCSFFMGFRGDSGRRASDEGQRG
jgi:hypothetical protein